VVCRLDHVRVVLDHDDGVAGVDQAREHFEPRVDVGEVQARGGLVEQVEGPARAPAREGSDARTCAAGYGIASP